MKRKSRRKSLRKSRRKSLRKSRRKTVFRFKSDTWTIYTMNGCPWCKKAEEILDKKGKTYKSILGVGNPEVEIKMKNAGKSDYKYWPKIFHNDEFVGGYSDLEKRLG